MTNPAPMPLAPLAPPGLGDVSYPPAQAAVLTMPPAPAQPAVLTMPPAPAVTQLPRQVVNISDVTYPVAAAMDTQVGPVTESDPLPIPDPVATTRTPVTTPPPEAAAKVSIVGGIAPEVALYKPEPTAKATPVRTASAPAGLPTQAVEIAAGSQIAGGPVIAPVVTLPQGAPVRAVATPYQIAPSVLQFAERNGVDLSQVAPSKGGKITKKDIETAIAARAALTEVDAPVQVPVEVATDNFAAAAEPGVVLVPTLEPAPFAAPAGVAEYAPAQPMVPVSPAAAAEPMVVDVPEQVVTAPVTVPAAPVQLVTVPVAATAPATAEPVHAPAAAEPGAVADAFTPAAPAAPAVTPVIQGAVGADLALNAGAPGTNGPSAPAPTSVAPVAQAAPAAPAVVPAAPRIQAAPAAPMVVPPAPPTQAAPAPAVAAPAAPPAQEAPMAVPTAPPAQETAAPAAAPALSDNLSERRFRISHGGGQLRRARSAEDFLMASPDKIQNLNIVDSYLEASPDGDVYVVVVLDNTMVVDL